MQTFLPYSDFEKCAKVLDNKRLNKQHVEAYQIIKTLENGTKSWRNHPAVRMWEKNIDALKYYANCMKTECINRGFKSEKIPFYDIPNDIYFPDWLGWSLVHLSHQSNLLNKNPEHYSQFNWIDFDIKGYYWPAAPKGTKGQKINELWVKTIIEWENKYR